MIFASDNDKRVRFYCIDYKGNTPDVERSICRPTVRKYDDVESFLSDHEDVAELYPGINPYWFEFYEIDYAKAMSEYNLDGMVCYDEGRDLWSNLD